MKKRFSFFILYSVCLITISLSSCKKDVSKIIEGTWIVSSDKLGGVEYLGVENSIMFSSTYMTSCNTSVEYNAYNSSLSSVKLNFRNNDSLIEEVTGHNKTMNPNATYNQCTTKYNSWDDIDIQSGWKWNLSEDEENITLINKIPSSPFGDSTFVTYKFHIEEYRKNKIVLKSYSNRCLFYQVIERSFTNEEIILKRE